MFFLLLCTVQFFCKCCNVFSSTIWNKQWKKVCQNCSYMWIKGVLIFLIFLQARNCAQLCLDSLCMCQGKNGTNLSKSCFFLFYLLRAFCLCVWKKRGLMLAFSGLLPWLTLRVSGKCCKRGKFTGRWLFSGWSKGGIL